MSGFDDLPPPVGGLPAPAGLIDAAPGTVDPVHRPAQNRPSGPRSGA